MRTHVSTPSNPFTLLNLFLAGQVNLSLSPPNNKDFLFLGTLRRKDCFSIPLMLPACIANEEFCAILFWHKKVLPSIYLEQASSRDERQHTSSPALEDTERLWDQHFVLPTSRVASREQWPANVLEAKPFQKKNEIQHLTCTLAVLCWVCSHFRT